jgi:hypothetical protein
MGLVDFIPVVILLLLRSNGANLTDGIELAAGLRRYQCWRWEFSFVSGNIIFLII